MSRRTIVPPLTPSPRHTGTEPNWWRRAVVYQVYPRSFQDSDGDGIGDIPGITARLDYLDALGVDVVWLSPVYRSPQDDNGYDISDYQGIDPLFGSLADLEALIAGLHERGMRLVMDLVVNHTSDEHAWFRASRQGPVLPDGDVNPYADWYIWRPARHVPGLAPGRPGTEPTNWGSVFSGPAWTWDEERGEFYLHLFSVKQPDLNWENKAVRDAVYSMMRWWLDRGVDGFRMDVINLISKTYPLVDGPRSPGARYGSCFEAVANGPRVHEFLAEMNREVFASRPGHILTVGETPGVTLAEASRYTDPARAELDMVFQFEHVGLADGPGGKFDPRPVDMVALKQNLASWQAALAPTADFTEVGWNSCYWDNHDQPRAVSRFGDDDPAWREVSAKTLASVLHLHRGTPYVYQGEELGQTNTVFTSIEDYRDLESINHFREQVCAGADPRTLVAAMAVNSRDNARTPVQWDDSPQAGFTTGEPWIDLAPNHRQINAASQVDVAGSVFEHYRSLIALRHQDETVALGTFRLLAADHPSAWVILRELVDASGGRAQVLLLAACSREDLVLNGAGGLWEALAAEGLEAEQWVGAEQLLRASDPTVQPGSGHTGAPGTLPGWDSLILRRRG